MCNNTQCVVIFFIDVKPVKFRVGNLLLRAKHPFIRCIIIYK